MICCDSTYGPSAKTCGNPFAQEIPLMKHFIAVQEWRNLKTLFADI